MAGVVGILWAGLALGQGLRTVGMGGLVLPGPESAAYNAAYAAYPGAKQEFRIPTGLISMAINPQTNVFNYFLNRSAFDSQFDFLAFYDQVLYLDSYLLNPPQAPDDIQFSIGSGGLLITDGQGHVLNLNFERPDQAAPTSLVPTPLFALPIPLPLPGFQAQAGLFVSADELGLAANDALRLALAGAPLQTNTTYSLTGSGNIKAGISGQVNYALAFPDLGLGRLYAGARAEAFYGLAYLEAAATALASTNNLGLLGDTRTQTSVFYAYPGNGSGYGLRADAGVAYDFGLLVVGAGMNNLLGLATWSGTQETTDENGLVTRSPSTRSQAGLDPSLFVNAALPLGPLTIGADWTMQTGKVHLGAEFNLGLIKLRGGVGYTEGSGINTGLGGAFSLGNLSLDAALTTHTAPLVGGTVYGIALALRY